LASALTDAGGTVSLLTSGNYQSYEIAPNDYNFRLISAGSLASVADANVPEPASLALMGIALSSMFGAKRLRKQRKQSSEV
jgi:ABC-type Fe3+-siderophore transport system permease subunit